jgi:hypothetical protein
MLNAGCDVKVIKPHARSAVEAVYRSEKEYFLAAFSNTTFGTKPNKAREIFILTASFVFVWTFK